MDPATLPEPVQTMIFVHLKTADILSLSTISKDWYNAIAKSPLCMRRLTIFYNQKNCENDIECLLASKRDYIRIDIKEGEKDTCEKIVSNQKRIASILKKFTQTVTSINTTMDIADVGELPKLRSLKVPNCYSLLKEKLLDLSWTGLIQANKAYIEKLQIACKMNIHALSLFKDFLKNMPNLKSLSLSQNIFNTPVDGQYEFPKLEYLNLRFVTLKFNHIEFIVSKIPNLRTLSIEGCYDWRNDLQTGRVLPINETVTKLLADNLFISDHISSFKAVKHVDLDYLDLETYEAIVACPSVQTVDFSMFDRGYCWHLIKLIRKRPNIKFFTMGMEVGDPENEDYFRDPDEEDEYGSDYDEEMEDEDCLVS